jgi:hypothetical protein
MLDEIEEARAGVPGLADNLARLSLQPPDSELPAKKQDIDALNQLTRDLEDMADWRDQLTVEIRRASLLFDLGLLTESHLEGLKRRVNVWREAAKELAEQMSGRLIGADDLGDVR